MHVSSGVDLLEVPRLSASPATLAAELYYVARIMHVAISSEERACMNA